MFKNILLAAGFVFAVSAFAISLKNRTIKTVFVDNDKLYNEFNLSKELNKELDGVLSFRKHILDSLLENIKLQNRVMENENSKKNGTEIIKLRKMQEEYLYKQKMFEEGNQSAINSCNEKIWKQINQYLQDYGKEKAYTFVFGTNGQGNIMFANDGNNITNEAIHYLNEKYENKIK